MSNLETVEFLTSIILCAHDNNDSDNWNKCSEIAHNAALYALSLPEDEREKLAGILVGVKEEDESLEAVDTDGCCLPHDFHSGMYCADCGAYNPEGR